MKKAVIDVGSNSVLLLVAEKTGPFWEPIYETSKVTALGEGTKQSGRLSEKGMSDTLHALAVAFREARDHGASSILAAATMAARIAKNSDEFLKRASGQDTPVFILSGEREAELGFVALAEDPLFTHEKIITAIDIGGHSTEIVNANKESFGWSTKFRKSFSLGTLGIRESILREERIDGISLMRAASAIDETLGFTFLPRQSGCTVSLGATGTNLVSMGERMTKWDPEAVNGAVLSYEDVSKAVGHLSQLSDTERAAIKGIEPGRERTIHIGALILERCMNALRVEEVRVSVRGWRYGLLTHPAEE